MELATSSMNRTYGISETPRQKTNVVFPQRKHEVRANLACFPSASLPSLPSIWLSSSQTEVAPCWGISILENFACFRLGENHFVHSDIKTTFLRF